MVLHQEMLTNFFASAILGASHVACTVVFFDGGSIRGLTRRWPCALRRTASPYHLLRVAIVGLPERPKVHEGSYTVFLQTAADPRPTLSESPALRAHRQPLPRHA